MDTTTEEARCRGAVFRSNLGYIKRKYGTSGLEALYKAMKEKGIDLDPDGIDDREWYPAKTRLAFLEAAYDLFSQKDEEMAALGKYAALYAQRLALSVRYAKETEDVVEESDYTWSKHWDRGRILVEENSMGKTVIRLEDFNLGRLQCAYLSGYFVGVAELSGANNVELEETHCMSRGDQYHRYVLTWIR